MEQLSNYKVSVLVPIYNVELYIARCVESLFQQTFSNEIEYVFVDDCSCDNSLKILNTIIERYPEIENHVKVIKHSRNKGLAAARETALIHATGEYLLTVDSDDWIETDMVEILYKSTNNSFFDVISCDYFVEYEHKTKVVRQQIGHLPKICLQNIFLGKAHGGTCFRLIKRLIFIQNDIHYIEGLNMLEDISVLHKVLLYAQNIFHVPKPYYHYYQGNLNSYSKRLSIQSKSNMLELIPLIHEQLKLCECEKEIWRAFEVFKLRVKALLVENSENLSEIRTYKSLYNDIIIDEYKNELSLKEKLLLDFKHLKVRGIYCLIKTIYSIRKFRNVLNL